MVLGIRKYGDAVLETPCEKVANFGSKELKALVFDMFETMYANKGVGLAAPQVGVLQQVTDGVARGRASGFAGQHGLVPPLAQPGREKPDLGRLAATFRAFKGDK